DVVHGGQVPEPAHQVAGDQHIYGGGHAARQLLGLCHLDLPLPHRNSHPASVGRVAPSTPGTCVTTRLADVSRPWRCTLSLFGTGADGTTDFGPAPAPPSARCRAHNRPAPRATRRTGTGFGVLPHVRLLAPGSNRPQ